MRVLFASALIAATVAGAQAAQSANIMFGILGTNVYGYDTEGNAIAGLIDNAPNTTVTVRRLADAVYNDYAAFDQIWIYDLDDNGLSANELTNYTNIANWWNPRQHKNVIMDGRIICSGGYCGPLGGEQQLITNYTTALAARGGGMVFGTDHSFAHSGINTLMDMTGFTGFYGDVFSQFAIVDPASPLMTPNAGHDCDFNGCYLWDASSPGYAPTGLQANGLTLTPVAYHGTVGGAFNNAAVSASMGSVTFGTENQGNQLVPAPALVALFGLGAVALFRRR